jgi:hypothetical protein
MPSATMVSSEKIRAHGDLFLDAVNEQSTVSGTLDAVVGHHGETDFVISTRHSARVK